MNTIQSCCVGFALLLGACSTTASSTKPAPIDQKVMMEKWMAFSTPSDGHRALDAKVGSWSLDVTMYPPGMPPMKSTGTNDVKWIMDGRYLQDTTQGSMEGQPFQGSGLTGYDNMKKAYTATWIDNMGTGVTYAEGQYDAKTKTFNYKSEAPDVMAGHYVKGRTTEHIVDHDHWTMEMFQNDEHGKEYKSMQINYTRRN